MSHVAKIEVEIKDLDALRAACAKLGLSFQEGKTSYAWFGRSVGDYPLPEGFTVADLGTCEHAIGVPGASYEIGVTRRRDGRPGFALLWDSWHAGGLERALGAGAGKLVQRYGIEAARRAALRAGYSVAGEQVNADGSITLRINTGR